MKHAAIYIAARQHQADGLAAHLFPLFQGGCQRRGAGAFGDVMGVGEIMTHRSFNLGFAYSDNALCVAVDDCNSICIRNAARQSIGHGVGTVGRNGLALRERQRITGRVLRHDANDFSGQPQRFPRSDTAADAGAKADRARAALWLAVDDSGELSPVDDAVVETRRSA